MDLQPASVLPGHLIANTRLVSTREDILHALPPGGVFCEVGVALGDFAARVLEICQPREYLGVDIYTLHMYPEMWDGRVGRELAGRAHKDHVASRFETEMREGRVRLIEGYSTDVIADLADGYVDVFYVDAHHSYESVSAELKLISSKIRAGGTIVANDYIMTDHYTGTRYGVVQAVNEFMIAEGWEMTHFALHPGMFFDVALRKLI